MHGNHEKQVAIHLCAQPADVLDVIGHHKRTAASGRFSPGQSCGRRRRPNGRVAPSADEPMGIIDGLGSVAVSNDEKSDRSHVVQTADVASVEFPDGRYQRARHRL